MCQRGGNPDVAKVVDFGLAREHATDASIVGTPAYLSPEAVTAPAQVGPAADVYALGAVAYYLLTGRCVFDGSVAELCRQHVEDEPPTPGIAPDVDALILACLAKDPARRPASAAALARELRAVRGHGWDAGAANAWWRGFRADDHEPVTSAPSMLITIDLGARAVAPLAPDVIADDR